MRVLGIDTGFASFGWAAVELGADLVLVDAGVIRTKKASKKSNLLATEDNFDRGRLIAHALEAVIAEHDPVAVCVESMSWPRNASVVAKMGLAWGILIGACDRHGLAVVQCSPQRIKRALTGQSSATKDAVLAALIARPGFAHLPQVLGDHGIPRGQWEHAVDSAAVVVASAESDVLRALSRIR